MIGCLRVVLLLCGAITAAGLVPLALRAPLPVAGLLLLVLLLAARWYGELVELLLVGERDDALRREELARVPPEPPTTLDLVALPAAGTVALLLVVALVVLSLSGCARPPLVATSSSGQVACYPLDWRRPSAWCDALYLCGETAPTGTRTWIQGRPPAPTIPAVRYPSTGCDSQDRTCLESARVVAIEVACVDAPDWRD